MKDYGSLLAETRSLEEAGGCQLHIRSEEPAEAELRGAANFENFVQ